MLVKFNKYKGVLYKYNIRTKWMGTAKLRVRSLAFVALNANYIK